MAREGLSDAGKPESRQINQDVDEAAREGERQPTGKAAEALGDRCASSAAIGEPQSPRRQRGPGSPSLTLRAPLRSLRSNH
jgi:hypothetical protein